MHEGHTPTPWHIQPGLEVDIASGPQGCLAYVSTAGARGRTLDEARANASLIVAAVNAHADLLAVQTAAELVLAALKDYFEDHEKQYPYDVISVLEQQLAPAVKQAQGG